MDNLNLFPRIEGLTPFVLLDGHGSRFELPFLEYINNPEHEWAVTIGVLYGTAIWQVGDSAEQNGNFNMLSVKAKRKIVDDKERLMIAPTIEPWEIINIINSAWGEFLGARKLTKKLLLREDGCHSIAT